jgi:hypothetical protein
MNENQIELLYQIRIDVTKDLAIAIRNRECKEFNQNIFPILNKVNGRLICQYDAFSDFVAECKSKGDVNNPLYKWTKDTIENENKKSKYLKSFTIYVNDSQLYNKKVADFLEVEIKNLKDKDILKINKYNSDPKNNPQPPKKYF